MSGAGPAWNVVNDVDVDVVDVDDVDVDDVDVDVDVVTDVDVGFNLDLCELNLFFFLD